MENCSRWSVFLKTIAGATGSSRASLAIVPANHLRFAVGCMYGWSDEARFAASLVSGFSIGEISGQLGISRETSRTHMRRVLSKTQTRRQGEVISLLLRGIPFSRQEAAN